MEIWEAIILAGFTGAISSIGTVAAIKTDIVWIKDHIRQHNKRITKLEELNKCTTA